MAGGPAPLRDPAMMSAGKVRRFAPVRAGSNTDMTLILFLIAAALVIYGIVRVVNGEVLVGILLVVAGCLVGPGGYSVFSAIPIG
jgi:hypothetical protein